MNNMIIKFFDIFKYRYAMQRKPLFALYIYILLCVVYYVGLSTQML